MMLEEMANNGRFLHYHKVDEMNKSVAGKFIYAK